MTGLRWLAIPAVLRLAAVAVPGWWTVTPTGCPRASRCGPRPPSGLGTRPRGVPAGSRVLLVLPPGLGYGQAGDRPDVDGHDTLIFAVGILAAL
jgi:hypothetical protein